MPTNPPSAAPPTNPVADATRAFIERLIAVLDPDFPAVIVEGQGGVIDEPAQRYLGRPRPDFVRADDEGWGARYD